MQKKIQPKPYFNPMSDLKKYKLIMPKRIAFTVATVLFCSFALAQQGNLGDQQINVVKAYQPTLSDAFKISDVPERDTAVTFIPEMNYDVDRVIYPTIYTISPIKAVRIKDQNLKELYRGFIKAGYGTKNSPYAEIFYNSLRSKDFNGGVHLSHYSSSGKIKGYGFPGMSETGIELYGSKFLKNQTIKGKIGYDRNVYHYYGYQDPPDIFSKSETKHSFDDISAEFSFNSNETNLKRFRYQTSIGLHSFSDNKSHTENNIVAKATMAQQINNGEFFGDVVLDFINYDTPVNSNDPRHIFRVNPRYKFDLEPVVITVGANLAIESNDKTDFHIYPFARVDYQVAEGTMNIYGEISGDLKRNTFRELSTENPFMEGPVGLLNSDNKLDLNGGLNLKLDKQLLLHVRGGIRSIDDDAFFVNLPAEAPTTLVKYNVGYLKNSQAYIHTEISYEQYEKTGISLMASYTSNSPKDIDEPLFRPNFKMGLKGYYMIANKIRVSSEWVFSGQQSAISYDGENDFKTVDGYVDGSLNVDYLYSKVLSIFLNFNNITATKYSRWYNYPSYRFMVLGGLTYSF
jgi:hypothetical protein